MYFECPKLKYLVPNKKYLNTYLVLFASLLGK